MEEGDGEGEEERGEGVGTGFGRGVDDSDSGCIPVEGGVEHGGGEEQQAGVVGIGLGRGGWESKGVGDERVGDGDGVADESGTCFGVDEDTKVAAEGTCAAVEVAAEAA